MKILDDIELVDLGIFTNNTLIVTDFHIGYEESLNKRGVMVPRFQFEEVMKRLEKMFFKLKKHKVERIIVNGDLKHEFGAISDQEWRHTLQLLDYFRKYCKEIILIKGNHDTILDPIAEKRNVKVLDNYLIEPSTIKNDSIKKSTIKDDINKIINKKSLKNNILVLHGDSIPSKKLLKGVSTIIIGHEHPAVSVSEGPRVELFKAFLIGKWKKYNLIVEPSFNLVTEGTDVLRNRYAISGTPKIPKDFSSVLKEKVLSPFLKGNLKNFEAVIVSDKLYKFGKLKDLN
jgi:uncharacterized protein